MSHCNQFCVEFNSRVLTSTLIFALVSYEANTLTSNTPYLYILHIKYKRKIFFDVHSCKCRCRVFSLSISRFNRKAWINPEQKSKYLTRDKFQATTVTTQPLIIPNVAINPRALTRPFFGEFSCPSSYAIHRDIFTSAGIKMEKKQGERKIHALASALCYLRQEFRGERALSRQPLGAQRRCWSMKFLTRSVKRGI